MRTNRSFRITYFDAATSKDVGCAEHINLTGETIITDTWADANMPVDVAELQDSTNKILWDAEPIDDPEADLGTILKLLRVKVEEVLQRAGITSPPSQEARLSRLRDEFLDEEGRVKVRYATDVFDNDYGYIFCRDGLIELFVCVHTTVRLIENTASLCRINEGSLKHNFDEVFKHFRKSVHR